MTIPLFKDIGKKAKDLLSKEYTSDHKFELKTNTANGVTFTANGARSNKDGSLGTSLSAKYKHDSGVTGTVKTNSKGDLTGEATIEGVADGLKLTINTAHKNPEGRLGAEFVHEYFSFTGDFDVYSLNGAASAVVGAEGFTIGAKGAFDSKKSAVSSYGLAFGYSTSEFAVSGSFNAKNGSKGECGGAYIHNVDSATSVAAEYSHDLSSNKNRFSVGGQYKQDKENLWKGKINSDGVLNVAWVSNISSSIALTTSAEVNTLKLDKDSHKLGLSLVLSN